jgi:hypothetical protein
MERLNKILEELLRSQCALSQEDWDVHLPYVEFAYNNSPRASSKFSPFFVDIGRHPLCSIDHLVGVSTSMAGCMAHLEEFLSDQKLIHILTKDNLLRAQANQEDLINKKRRNISFQVNDLVVLDSKNLLYVRIGTGKAKLFPR